MLNTNNRVDGKLRWGIISTASIGLRKVIPAMQRGQLTTVVAIATIASRDLAKAQKTARDLGIPEAFGSYEELLADPAVDAVYNPLSNQLHVPWTLRAAEAGKHVLCEKPLSLTVAEAETLLAVRSRYGVKIGEAFMIRCAPQWLRLRELLDQGRVGELRSVVGFFSYFNVDPANIRNQAESGGGALMDIGCYLIHSSRFAFQQEPTRVVAKIERDPRMRTDRLTSVILDFPAGQSIFTCSTQLVPYQRIHFLGTRGRIEIEIPFNAPNIVSLACSSMTEAISRGTPLPQRHFRCAINTHCRGYLLQNNSGEQGCSCVGRGWHEEHGRDRSRFSFSRVGAMGNPAAIGSLPQRF